MQTPEDAMKSSQLRPALRRCAWFLVLCSQLLVLRTQPVRAEANDDYNVGVQFFKQERWDSSARSFRKFLTANGRSAQAPAARLYLGQALIQQRKFAEARDVFREYVKRHADADQIALARYRVSECSYFLQDDQAAVGELTEYIERHPGHELVPRAQLYRGQTQLRLDDPGAAAESLTALIARKPEPGLLTDAQFALAKAEEARGRVAEATPLYELLADEQESPHAAEARMRLGTIAFQARDYEVAAERFESVTRDFPEHRLASRATLNAGYAEYSLGQWSAALEHFEQAAADEEQSALAGMWIGLTHKQAGDVEQAAAAFRAVYERDQEQPLAEKLLFHWADSELRRGASAEARRLFEAVADRWPDGERADDSLHLATEAALRAGDQPAAERLNSKFENDYPDSSLRWPQRILAGQLHLARGDELREANESDPAAVEAYQRAIELLDRVVGESGVAGTRQSARLHLARGYQKLENDEKVIDTLDPLVDAFRADAARGEFADGLLLQARSLNEVGRHADAASVVLLYLKALDQIRSADPVAAYGELALAQTHLADASAVNVALDQLTQLDGSESRAAEAAYRCAEAAYAAESWELAAELFERAAAFDFEAGYKAASLSGLGYSRYEAQRYSNAAEAFAELLALKADDRRLASNAAHMRGLSLQLAGQNEEAIAAYQDGLNEFAPAEARPVGEGEIDPVYNAYRCGKGAARLLREMGRVDDSDAAYEAGFKALTALPVEKQTDLDKFINEWALLSYEHQRFERSDELFHLLNEKRPESDLADDALMYLGESRYFDGDLEAAHDAFAKLVADQRADDFVKHRASLLLLDIAAQNESWDELLALADRFLEQFPESSERAFARYRAAEAALQTGELDRSIAELTTLKGFKDDPATEAEWYSSVYVLLGEAQYRAKDYAGVEATVSEFRQRFPTTPLLYHADAILGRSYIKRAMFDEAREALNTVITSAAGRRTKTAAKAQFHIAETYVIEKDYETALAEYYKVYVNYKVPDFQAPALFQAGQCDETLKNWNGAVKTYDLLIEEFSDSEYSEKARERLSEVRARIE